MRVSIDADQRMWLPLPHTFPTADGLSEREWEDGVIEGMRQAWSDDMDELAESMLREALRHGRNQILPEDSVTLQFWPAPDIVNAVVHIIFAEDERDSRYIDVPVDDLVMRMGAVFDVFEAPRLGEGLEARYRIPAESDDAVDAAGVNYLFRGEHAYVLVILEPTFPEFVALALDPLRDVVRAMEIVDDPGRRWARTTFDESILARLEERWPHE